MKYRVVLEVVYSTEVEADNEEEAIEQALAECPYDNADEVEPIVEPIDEEKDAWQKYYDFGRK